MIIIADAGSTKIEWVAVSTAKKTEFRLVTSGHNAAVAPDGTLAKLISDEGAELRSLGREVREIHYYGAGCAGDRCLKVAGELSEIFPSANCHVNSDMLAAARSLCGHEPGIACILGTGSNSCLYDGERIADNVSPLGFILGDEGSGAVLGRQLLGHIFKKQLPHSVIGLFKEEYPELSLQDVIERVYRCGGPNAYLASFAPFLSRHIDIPEIDRFVSDEFERFFRFNVLAYEGAGSLPVNFIGSIAYNFAPQLKNAAERCGCHIGRIEQAPMEALIDFHCH